MITFFSSEMQLLITPLMPDHVGSESQRAREYSQAM